MSARIFSKPNGNLMPANQPLIFSIDDDQSNPPGRFVVVVRASGSATGTVTTEYARMFLTPNTNGKAFFDLGQIAKGMPEPITQSGSGLPIHATEHLAEPAQGCVRRYIVEVGSYNTTTGNLALNQDNATQFVCVGVEQLTSGLHPDFSPYYWGGSIGWLTERPNPSETNYYGAHPTVTLRMRSDEERTISLLCPLGMGQDQSNGKVVWTLVRTSGTVVTHSEAIQISGATRERMQHVGVGWPNINSEFSVSLSNVAYILVTFEKNQPSVIDGSVIKIIYDDSVGCRNTSTQVAWINTRGGWEYLRFDSRAPRQISVEGKQYRKNIASYSGNSYSVSSTAAQYETYAKTGRTQYTLQEYFFDVEERALLDSLMRSKTVQIRRPGETGWLPVTVLTNSLVIEPAGSQFYNVSLQVEIAQDIRC